MKGKRLLSLAAAVLSCVLLTGCAGVRAPASGGETQHFTDSAGREVVLAARPMRIAPSGPLAQMILYTLCPDRLMGLSAPFSRTQKAYIDEAYWDLPVFGHFYGKNATMNFEAIISAAPDCIIDMGESKETIAGDLDGIQRQTGLPVLFIEASLTTMAEAYDTLGELLGLEEEAETHAAYIRSVMDRADGCRAQIETPVTFYYGQEEYGLATSGKGSTHTEAVETAGGVNVAELETASGEGEVEVSIEQVMLWDPDVILLAPDSCYEEIFTDPVWSNVRAVREGRVYEIPLGPYSWTDRPPSVQRVLGVLWAGELLYPELYHCDITAEAQRFYQLFFHYDLTREEAQDLLAHSSVDSAGR